MKTSELSFLSPFWTGVIGKEGVIDQKGQTTPKSGRLSAKSGYLVSKQAYLVHFISKNLGKVKAISKGHHPILGGGVLRKPLPQSKTRTGVLRRGVLSWRLVLYAVQRCN
jgi:hypothetical protein